MSYLFLAFAAAAAASLAAFSLVALACFSLNSFALFSSASLALCIFYYSCICCNFLIFSASLSFGADCYYGEAATACYIFDYLAIAPGLYSFYNSSWLSLLGRSTALALTTAGDGEAKIGLDDGTGAAKA